MQIEKIAIELLKKGFVCNNCLGREFAKLLSGYSNAERGKAIRDFIALAIDSGLAAEIDASNFFGYKFRENKEFAKRVKKPGKCWVCDDFFKNIDKVVKKIVKKLQSYEFSTFLVGCRPSRKLLQREEEIWEISIEFCEPIKVEINREVGKRLEKLLNKKVNLKNPDIAILIDMEKNKISLTVNSLFIFGYYQKLVRGIPQCRWGTPKKYKTSVEQIIGTPLMQAAKGKNHKLHGAGREDISARCLGWRPFVIEIIEPRKRKINLNEIRRKINKSGKVKVKSLKFSDMATVRKIKEAQPDKTYLAIISLGKPMERKELKKLKNLIGIIRQRTPRRVLHRRADLLRKRKVKSIKCRQINRKKIELKIKTQAGLYIKELINGDKGRTKPSVSELLNCKAKCERLDVIKIEKIKV